jgi:hypothetical protein
MTQLRRLVALVVVVVVTEMFRLVLVALGRLIKDLLVVMVYERPEVVAVVVAAGLEEWAQTHPEVELAVMAALALLLLSLVQAFQEVEVEVVQANRLLVALQPLVVVTVGVGSHPVVMEPQTQEAALAALMMRQAALAALVLSSSKSQIRIAQSFHRV